MKFQEGDHVYFQAETDISWECIVDKARENTHEATYDIIHYTGLGQLFYAKDVPERLIWRRY